jgi:8-oxo-dGTP pyrophosphatase MutT (NUDIX family)
MSSPAAEARGNPATSSAAAKNGGTAVVERRAGRVLLVDRAGRALLLHGGDPARPGERWWFTPGGGLSGAETPAEGAARELWEETGLRVDPAELGGPIWHEIAEFSYDNRQYRQEQDFFLLRVADWQVDTAGMSVEEQMTIIEHRWWSAAELDASTEQIFPSDLASLLRRHGADAVGDDRAPVPEMGL